AEASMREVAAARAEQAALVERASGLDAEVARLERDAADLDERIAVRRRDIERLGTRGTELREAIASNKTALDEDVRALEAHRAEVVECDARVGELRRDFDAHEGQARSARHALDDVRTEVMQAEVAKAGAAS